MKFSRYVIFLFLLLDACIEPFTAKIPDGARPIVVDGLITDQPGPYTVQIFRSASLNNPYAATDYIKGAQVSILDDEGNAELLVEATPGNYQTQTTQGVVGRTYHVHIQTTNGDIFESTPEKMIPAGDFSNLRYEFKQNVNPPDDDQLHPKNGFDIFFDAQFASEQQGLARWRYTGTFEFRSYPELRKKAVGLAVIVYIPDPPTCSGYVVPIGSTSMIQISDCTCCLCWVNQHNDTPLLSDKRFVKNDQVSQYNVAFIPANKRYFYDKYYLDVEQISVSPAVYDFWKRIGAQQKQSSDLFQTPAPATTGNVQSLKEGGSPVVGIFGVSAVTKHSFILYPSDVPYAVDRLDTIANDCRILYPNSSVTPPAFW